MPPEGFAEVQPFWDPIGGASLASTDWPLFVSLLDASAFGVFLPQAFPLLAFSASGASLLWVLLLRRFPSPGSSCFASRGGFAVLGWGFLDDLAGLWQLDGATSLVCLDPGGYTGGSKLVLGLVSCLPVP